VTTGAWPQAFVVWADGVQRMSVGDGSGLLESVGLRKSAPSKAQYRRPTFGSFHNVERYGALYFE